MSERIDICTLDYLVGTLATAYKGMVTSLVARDFCIAADDEETHFKGTLLSMPEGDYEIALMLGGKEISKIPLGEDGYFEFAAGSQQIEEAGNLQLDVIQRGKHIGTFLLKKETAGGFYISAFELSNDLKDFNFRSLNEQLKDKKGIQKKGESVITSIISTKKDWKDLSNHINTFARDLFWSDRDAFMNWYTLMVRFSAHSSERASDDFVSKAVANLFDLIEMPLNNEEDRDRLKRTVGIWLREIGSRRIVLAHRLKNCIRILRSVHTRFPHIDLRTAVTALLRSIEERLEKAVFVDDRTYDVFLSLEKGDGRTGLEGFTETRRDKMRALLDRARDRIDGTEDLDAVLNGLDTIDPVVFDPGELARILFHELNMSIGLIPVDALSDILNGIARLTGGVSPDTYNYALSQLSNIVGRLISDQKVDHCLVVLEYVEHTEETFRDDFLFRTGTARALLDSGSDAIVSRYKDLLMKTVIPAPSVRGFSDLTWSEIANPLHFRRLQGFIDVLSLAPGKLETVLTHVISCLFINGVFIPDDRLFQRNITAYMNAVPLTGNFLQHYILLRMLPVYYHDVGASGTIRDLTTEIDSWGNDPVIYFIRKQVHVNASNYNIRLIEQVLRSWITGDPSFMRKSVPEEVFDSIDRPLLSDYATAMRSLFDRLGIRFDDRIPVRDLLSLSDNTIGRTVKEIDASDEIRSKIVLICRIYRAIVAKYEGSAGDGRREENTVDTVSRLMSRLSELKAIYTDDAKTVAAESLYFKRHIAFGIPSVIGSYHEPKFDAFGEALGIEERVRVLIEGIIMEVDASEDAVSETMLTGWIRSLQAIHELFEIHGLSNPIVTEVIRIMKSNRLYLSQVNDLLRMWQKEVTWMVEFVYRLFHRPLTDILSALPEGEIPEGLRRLKGDGETFVNRAADILMRNILNSITGFEELDRLLNSLIKCIGKIVESGKDLELSLSDRPVVPKDLYRFDELNEKDAASLAPHLGNKAKNLAVLYNKGLQVPFGVVFPSLHSTDFAEYTKSTSFSRLLRDAVEMIGSATGRTLGDGVNPLLVAVRSGSYISMPGILSSILYCGLNEKTIKAFAASTGDPWLARDSYRRFIEHYSSVVHRIPEEHLDGISQDILTRYGVRNVRDLDVEQLKELAGAYDRMLKERGVAIPDDPFEQLRQSVTAIYRSWTDEKALQFRKAMNVSEHWGTAVTIIPMITANSKDAGASVFFTHKPFSYEKGVFGETRRMATGDDIVYGKLSSRPISREQVTDDSISLEDFDPELYALHLEGAGKIEQAMGNLPQEVEAAYTIDKSGKRTLYILQTKRMEFRRGYIEKFHDICRMESSIIGRGIGVHGGALSGIVTFSDSIEHIRELRTNSVEPIVLLRSETSTDDVALMPEIEGIVTSTGGATSHAAILAQKFDLTAVVGCGDMTIKQDDTGSRYAIIGDIEIYEGTPISIDGLSGIVYSGVCLLTVKEETY